MKKLFTFEESEASMAPAWRETALGKAWREACDAELERMRSEGRAACAGCAEFDSARGCCRVACNR